MKKQSDNKSIVLVEDEQVMVSLLANRLKKEGYEVRTATDGAGGLEMILAEKPDLVLLDMMLPRMSGFQILEKLAENKIIPKLPVVIISNSGQPIELDRALKLGARDYLIKVNFDPEEIVAKVKKVLGEEGGAPENTPEINNNFPKVLIVEDDIFLIELLERKFKNSKITTFRAMDTEHARAILNKEKIEMILLDVVMPGMDGITFLKELKKTDKLKNIPVVIISNLGQKEEMDKGYAAGAVDYIIKANATPSQIVEKTKALITKK